MNNTKVTGTMQKGDFINGIIEEYKVASGGNVNAGDFVKFLTDYSQTNNEQDTKLSLYSNAGKYISATALSENKIFVAYTGTATQGYYTVSQVKGIVCIIDGTTITVGTETTITSDTSYTLGEIMSAVTLNENKVFIAYSHKGNSNVNEQLYGLVCTINGTTISAGTATAISTVQSSGYTISAVALLENKVFIAHSYGTGYIFYGIVCTISGTTITVGTDTQLNNISHSGERISAVVLSTNKVFIAHSYGNDIKLYGIICTISETTITKGTDTELNSTTNAGLHISTVALLENKVFIAHSYGNDIKLYGIICTISGTSITKKTDTVLNSENNTGRVVSAIAFNDNKVLVVHSDGNNYLYSMLCDINGTIITKGTDRQLSSATYSGYVISAAALAENKAFIAHNYSSSYYLYGLVQDYFLNLVKTITSSTEKIGGVAITSGTSGEMVSVKKPNV